MTSFNRRLAGLIGTTGDVKSTGLDNIASGDADYYLSLDSLPVTGLSKGDNAFVEENRRLYVSNGSGWYNTDFIASSAPRWDSGGEPDSSYQIADSATPLTIVARAVDSDNPTLVNQSFASDSAQYMVTISNDSSVWTFTPKTVDSIGASVLAGDLTDSNGDFLYTFKWSDGTSIISKAVTITYNTGLGGPGYYGDRGFIAGGYDGSTILDTIDYISIPTPGDAAIFGTLTRSFRFASGYSDGTKCFCAHGNTGTQDINVWVAATTGNATTHAGSQVRGRIYAAGISNNTYALTAGGFDYEESPTVKVSDIEYFVMQTNANSSTFGSTVTNQPTNFYGWNDTTRGLWVGGGVPYSKAIDYVTIDTPANASDWGDLRSAFITYGLYTHSMAGDETYALTFGGKNQSYSNWINNIETLTIQTLGSGSDFGNLVRAKRATMATSDGTTAVVMGGTYDNGNSNGAPLSEMDYVTIQTSSNASDFGDLRTTNAHQGAAPSGLSS